MAHAVWSISPPMLWSWWRGGHRWTSHQTHSYSLMWTLKTPPWEPVHQSGGPPCEPGPRRRLDTAPLQGFDPREERPGAEGQSDEGPGTERGSGQSEGWMYPSCVAREMDLEPVDYDLDLSREVVWPLNGKPLMNYPERHWCLTSSRTLVGVRYV